MSDPAGAQPVKVVCHLEIALTPEGDLLIRGEGARPLAIAALEMAKAHLLTQKAKVVEECEYPEVREVSRIAVARFVPGGNGGGR